MDSEQSIKECKMRTPDEYRVKSQCNLNCKETKANEVQYSWVIKKGSTEVLRLIEKIHADFSNIRVCLTARKSYLEKMDKLKSNKVQQHDCKIDQLKLKVLILALVKTLF